MSQAENQASDSELARRVQQGNTEAFGTLVERYGPRIFRYARRFLFGYHDAEDAAQEAFLKAFINIRGYDPARPFSSWLYRIAHNEFIDTIRRRKHEPLPLLAIDEFFPGIASAIDPAREADDAALRAMLETQLASLDPKYREPLVLYHWENLDYREIADIMRIPVATVGVRLKRGRDRLRRLLANQQ